MDWLKRLKETKEIEASPTNREGINDNQDKPVISLSINCSWLNKDVPMSECHKPKSCLYQDDKDRPVECLHLKAFIRQRNKELGLNG